MGYNRVYLVDVSFKEKVRVLLGSEEAPFLQVGCGGGFLTQVVPDPKVLVDPHSDLPGVIRRRIQDLQVLPLEAKTMVSNLPFDQSMAILFHCIKYYSTIKNYYVVVQKEVADGILKGRTSLGFRTRHCFEVKKLDTLKKGSFNPRPKVDSTFLHLKRKEGLDFKYLDFLRGLKSPRKKLKSNFLGASEEYCNRRLGELSDQEAYKFYKSSVGLEV